MMVATASINCTVRSLVRYCRYSKGEPSRVRITTPLCFWEGKGAECPRGRVDGTIPNEVCLLTDLQSKITNFLTGTIPMEIGMALAHLSLRDNQLSGTIPTEVGLLTAMTSLEIARNPPEGNMLYYNCQPTSIYHPSFRIQSLVIQSRT